MNQLQTKLKELNACDGPDGPIEWAKDYDTLQSAWDNCKRGDWMLWLIENQEWGTDKQLRLMAVDFARQVQHLMTDQRSIDAIDVAERYANGEATDDELAAAAMAARTAAWAAAAWAAMAAMAAAAMAARTAAMAAAAWAARAAAGAAARAAARAAQSDIIRKWMPIVQFQKQKQ